MPIVRGKRYAEVESTGLLSRKFTILIINNEDSQKLKDFVLSLEVLLEYLLDMAEPVKISLYRLYVGNEPDFYQSIGVPVVELDDVVDDQGKLTYALEKVDADLVVKEDSNTGVVDFENRLVEGIDQASKSVEVFVHGHDIPWSFSNPYWGANWTTFYTLSDSFAIKANQWYTNKFSGVGLDEKAIEILRSLLLNRVSSLCYTRDKLLFYNQQRNFANRRKWARQDFSFESAYYLSHYYVTLSGGLDQISRILNLALNIGIDPTKYGLISIHREDFLNKIGKKSIELKKIFEEKDFLDWAKQLKRNRNFTAHEGTIILRQIMLEPDNMPTDEELENEAKAQPEWSTMKRVLSPDMFNWYHASVKQKLLLGRYKEEMDDALVIEEDGQKHVSRPLINIEWDFRNFELILLKTVETLFEYLQSLVRPQDQTS